MDFRDQIPVITRHLSGGTDRNTSLGIVCNCTDSICLSPEDSNSQESHKSIRMFIHSADFDWSIASSTLKSSHIAI